MPRKTDPGIYEILNTVNGSRYVGQSINCADRLYHHRYDLTVGRHKNQILQRAWDKYGHESFEMRKIECVRADANELASREQAHMDISSAYNIHTSSVSALGVKRRPEMKEKMRVFRTGKKLSEETRQKVIEKLKGHHVSPETRLRISASQKGRQFTEEHRAKLVESRRGKSPSAETRAKMSKSHMGNSNWMGRLKTAQIEPGQVATVVAEEKTT